MRLYPSPRVRRYVSQIIPFGIISLLTGWLFLFVELAVDGFEAREVEGAITMNVAVFIYASVAITVVGLLVGVLEMVILQQRFVHFSLSRKIVYKLLIYLVVIHLVLIFNFPIAAALELETNLLDGRVWEKLGRFFNSFTYLSTIVQLTTTILLCLFYSAISENLGHQVLLHFVTGKYHRPKVENRIFMFLDMKSSTTIAEKLGHQSYFDLLKKYYAAMNHPIIDQRGEVYQYIGDEVVISWKLRFGAEDQRCVRCFYEIKTSLESKREEFLRRFGVFPDFRAGMHCGEVTVGEVGALKKEIVFTGDVLNTTARIQSCCKVYGLDLLISSALADVLPDQPHRFEWVGEELLQGKDEVVQLYAPKGSKKGIS